MADLSKLDSKYFIDEYVFNCPFCNRRNVSYTITDKFEFDWNCDKMCYAFLVCCGSCKHTSFHLSYNEVRTKFLGEYNGKSLYAFINDDDKEIDDEFFHSVPTSFFTLDQSIPKKLRELFIEAEGCLQGNFLTGASACARKLIYELAVLEKAEGDSYDERIKSLKTKNPDIDTLYFDTLLTIQQITSSKVHENAYDGWESKHIKVITATLKEILTEIYVEPALRLERRKALISMKDELIPDKDKEKKKDKKDNKSNEQTDLVSSSS